MNRHRILVVDDSVDLAKALKMSLEQAGPFEIRIVNDPLQAKAACIDFRPELVLMDVIMPGMDGGTTAALLREDPAFARLPVIFLTSILDKQEAAQHGGHLGRDPVIAKPVTLSELLPRIHHVLEHR